MPLNIPGLRNPSLFRHAHPASVGTYLSVFNICFNLPGRGFRVKVPVTHVAPCANVECCKKLPKGALIKYVIVRYETKVDVD